MCINSLFTESLFHFKISTVSQSSSQEHINNPSKFPNPSLPFPAVRSFAFEHILTSLPMTSISGPQSDRDAAGSYMNTSISPSPHLLPSQSPSSSSGPAAERVVYESEIKRLRERSTGLESVVDRLSRELRGWQVKHGEEREIEEMAGGADLQGSNGGKDVPEWITNPSILTPLLNAYDTKMSSLQALTTSQRRYVGRARPPGT